MKPGKIYPGPRPEGSPVYGQRLEALIECERFASENFRGEWKEYQARQFGFGPDFRAAFWRAEFRTRARRALAGIRAMRTVIRMS